MTTSFIYYAYYQIIFIMGSFLFIYEVFTTEVVFLFNNNNQSKTLLSNSFHGKVVFTY